MLDRLRKLFRGKADSDVPSVREYRRYRTTGINLSHKIVETMRGKTALQRVSQALGMMGRDNILVFDSESEISVLMDYALYEYEKQGKNLVERYHEEIGGETPLEEELLAAMLNASTSLYQVKSISKRTHTLQLRDLIHEGHTLTLMDINFSKTITSARLLFIRPLTLENFSMTSGFALIFSEHLKPRLIKQWQDIQRRSSYRTHGRKAKQSVSAQRHVAFFKLSKRQNIQVRYEKA
jgi:hypothetical protein